MSKIFPTDEDQVVLVQKVIEILRNGYYTNLRDMFEEFSHRLINSSNHEGAYLELRDKVFKHLKKEFKTCESLSEYSCGAIGQRRPLITHVIERLAASLLKEPLTILRSCYSAWANEDAKFIDSLYQAKGAANSYAPYKLVDTKTTAGVNPTNDEKEAYMSLEGKTINVNINSNGSSNLAGRNFNRNLPAVEQVTRIYGVDAPLISDSDIFSIIGQLEGEIEQLEKIKNKPEKLKNQIKQLQKEIKSLIAHCDGE